MITPFGNGWRTNCFSMLSTARGGTAAKESTSLNPCVEVSNACSTITTSHQSSSKGNSISHNANCTRRLERWCCSAARSEHNKGVNVIVVSKGDQREASIRDQEKEQQARRSKTVLFRLCSGQCIWFTREVLVEVAHSWYAAATPTQAAKAKAMAISCRRSKSGRAGGVKFSLCCRGLCYRL